MPSLAFRRAVQLAINRLFALPTTQAFGDVAATGTSGLVAQSDHKHGMPADPTGGAWISWTPTYGATGSMTYTSVVTGYAKYIQMGKTVFFALYCSGTTGGTASDSLTFTLPVAPANIQGIQGGCGIRDTGTAAGSFNGSSGSTVVVLRHDAANWNLGAGKYILASGVYEAT